ncbi:thiaminase II [Pasteurellaceae bacterium RH1A]|nr:thiaminase II [Pasteurellaceae bacterium RH1A]
MTISTQLIQHAAPFWQAYTQHEFVRQLGAGTLPKACFQHYLKQDYLYLFHYSRALALAIYKAENFAQMDYSRRALEVILSEVQLHIAFCKQWGISESELQALPESAACVAYTRYVLDCGANGSLAELYAAIAPCAIGYAHIGKRLAQTGVENNPYQAWIDTYASPEFQAGVAELEAFLDQLCQGLSEQQLAKIQTIFNTATRMEAAFWQMGLDLSE